MFENHTKSLIQHCERSELCLHFGWTKVDKKCQKWSIWRVLKPEACNQTMLPDRSFLKGQKLVENANFLMIFKHCVTTICYNSKLTKVR